jgi:hypothetical protein
LPSAADGPLCFIRNWSGCVLITEFPVYTKNGTECNPIEQQFWIYPAAAHPATPAGQIFHPLPEIT